MAILLDILAAGVVDNSGAALSSGVVYAYQVGTTTKVAVYSDNDLTNAVSNPITLSAAGKAEVYTDQPVRLVIESSAGAAIDDLESVGVESSIDSIIADIIPDTDDAHTVGSADLRFAEGHFVDLYADNAYIGNLTQAGANTPGWLNNLGIQLFGGTLSIISAQGSVLSDGNPGYVTVPSTTAGQFAVLKVTAGGSFNDDSHASSDLTNFGFGITETTDWASDVPFFLYVINRANSDVDGADGSSVFALARSPSMATSPASANNIGDTGAVATTDDQTSILILDDVTVANYVSLPCQLVGAVRMRWSTTTDDWTVQTLGNKDGLGEAQLQKTFGTTWDMPFAQNGAATNTHFLANGGTAPLFTNNHYTYRINRLGEISLRFNINTDAGTDGAGAVSAKISIPYTVAGSVSVMAALLYLDCVGAANVFVQAYPIFAQTYFEINLQTGANVTNANFSNGSRSLSGTFTYLGSF